MFFYDDIANETTNKAPGLIPLSRSETYEPIAKAIRADTSWFERVEFDKWADETNNILKEQGLDISVPGEAFKRITLTPNSPDYTNVKSMEDLHDATHRQGFRDKQDVEAYNDAVKSIREKNPQLNDRLKTLSEFETDFIKQTQTIRKESAEAASQGSGTGNMMNSLYAGFKYGVTEPENIAAIAASVALTPFTGGATGATLLAKLAPRIGIYLSEGVLGATAEASISDRKEAFRLKTGLSQKEVDQMEKDDILNAFIMGSVGGAALDGIGTGLRYGVRYLRNGKGTKTLNSGETGIDIPAETAAPQYSFDIDNNSAVDYDIVGGNYQTVLDRVYSDSKFGKRSATLTNEGPVERQILQALGALEDANPRTRIEAISKIRNLVPEAITSSVRMEMDSIAAKAQFELTTPPAMTAEDHLANFLAASSRIDGEIVPSGIALPSRASADAYRGLQERIAAGAEITRADLGDVYAPSQLEILDARLADIGGTDSPALSSGQVQLNEMIEQFRNLKNQETPANAGIATEMQGDISRAFSELPESERGIYNIPEGVDNEPVIPELRNAPTESQIINDFINEQDSIANQTAEEISTRLKEIYNAGENINETSTRNDFDLKHADEYNSVTPEQRALQERILSEFGDNTIIHPDTGENVTIASLFKETDDDIEALDGILGCLIS